MLARWIRLLSIMRHYEAPESVKYHGGYDPSDPPYDPEAITEEVCPICSKLECICEGDDLQ